MGRRTRISAIGDWLDSWLPIGFLSVFVGGVSVEICVLGDIPRIGLVGSIINI